MVLAPHRSAGGRSERCCPSLSRPGAHCERPPSGVSRKNGARCPAYLSKRHIVVFLSPGHETVREGAVIGHYLIVSSAQRVRDFKPFHGYDRIIAGRCDGGEGRGRAVSGSVYRQEPAQPLASTHQFLSICSEDWRHWRGSNHGHPRLLLWTSS